MIESKNFVFRESIEPHRGEGSDIKVYKLKSESSLSLATRRIISQLFSSYKTNKIIVATP